MAAIKGLDTFLDVVDVLKNADKYGAKVEELKALAAHYTEAVEAVVALASVNDYTVNIKKREEESKAELVAARAEALKIKESAKAKAAEISDKAAVTIATANKAENDNNVRSTMLDSKAQQIEDHKKLLEDLASDLEQRERNLQKAEAEVADRLAKLKAVMVA